MWLFTKHGMFSAVAAKHADGSTDLSRVCVRARSLRHMQALAHEHGLSGEVTSSDVTDYAHRIVITRAQFGRLAHELAMDVDYTNFKASVTDDPRYLKLLHDVWELGWDLQQEEVR